jgi:hypothetical protein
VTPEDLVEIELIKRLKYRYLRCLDQKLWDEIETCFTPDATARYGGGLYEFEDVTPSWSSSAPRWVPPPC